MTIQQMLQIMKKFKLVMIFYKANLIVKFQNNLNVLDYFKNCYFKNWWIKTDKYSSNWKIFITIIQFLAVKSKSILILKKEFVKIWACCLKTITISLLILIILLTVSIVCKEKSFCLLHKNFKIILMHTCQTMEIKKVVIILMQI